MIQSQRHLTDLNALMSVRPDRGEIENDSVEQAPQQTQGRACAHAVTEH